MSEGKKNKPDPGCKHSWDPVAVKQLGTPQALLDSARTIVVMRCTTCGGIDHHVLPGHWTLDEVRRA